MADIIQKKITYLGFNFQSFSHPDFRLLKEISKFLNDNPHIDLRFYGNYSKGFDGLGIIK